jgi:hypothetical protein
LFISHPEIGGRLPDSNREFWSLLQCEAVDECEAENPQNECITLKDCETVLILQIAQILKSQNQTGTPIDIVLQR